MSDVIQVVGFQGCPLQGVGGVVVQCVEGQCQWWHVASKKCWIVFALEQMLKLGHEVGVLIDRQEGDGR